MPEGSPERSAAVRAHYDAAKAEAREVIRAAYPELEAVLVDDGGHCNCSLDEFLQAVNG